MLSGFAGAYERHWAEGMAAKLGLAAPDRELVEDILKLMRLQKVDFTQFFRALSAGTARTLFTEPEPFEAWSARREVLLPADRVAVAAAMDRVNPNAGELRVAACCQGFAGSAWRAWYGNGGPVGRESAKTTRSRGPPLRVQSASRAAVMTITRTITVAGGVFAPGHLG